MPENEGAVAETASKTRTPRKPKGAVKAPKARATPRKKADDGFPVDVAADFLSVGSIVVAPVALGDGPALALGYVKKLGKGYADVLVFHAKDRQETLRYHEPHRRLKTLHPDQLNSAVALFEQIKFEAAKNRKY